VKQHEAILQYAALGEPLDSLLIVDVHGHLGAAGGFDNPVRQPEELLAVMDRIGVEAVCVSHLLSLNGDYHLGNDLVADAVRRFPGRFLGYAVANPNRPEEIQAELDRCCHDLAMRAIKVHADFQGYPIDGEGYRRMYEYSQANGGLPVLGHGLSAAATARLAADYPSVPFIVAHSGGGYQGRFLDDIIGLAIRADNVYLDLCSSLAYFGALEVLVRQVGAEKLLFGSDLSYQQMTHAIGRILFARISDADKELILGLNAARLFRLTRS